MEIVGKFYFSSKLKKKVENIFFVENCKIWI